MHGPVPCKGHQLQRRAYAQVSRALFRDMAGMPPVALSGVGPADGVHESASIRKRLSTIVEDAGPPLDIPSPKSPGGRLWRPPRSPDPSRLQPRRRIHRCKGSDSQASRHVGQPRPRAGVHEDLSYLGIRPKPPDCPFHPMVLPLAVDMCEAPGISRTALEAVGVSRATFRWRRQSAGNLLFFERIQSRAHARTAWFRRFSSGSRCRLARPESSRICSCTLPRP